MDQSLRVFVTVAEKRNFSRAAEELHMTQPAVSQYIRGLEDNMGVRLLDRTSKYVRLNQAGKIVYHHAKEIIGMYSGMQNLVDDLSNKSSGPLSIGASYTFGEYILPHVIAQMKKIYPDIQPAVTISNTNQIAELVTGHQLEVGIIEGHIKANQHTTIEEFADDRLVVVVSPKHPFVQKRGKIDTKELEGETWILRESGSGTREAAESMLKHLNIHPPSIIRFGSTQPIKEAVEAGLGISYLSLWTIKKELRHGHLFALDVKDLSYTRKFSLVTHSPFQTKALQSFIELLYQFKDFNFDRFRRPQN